MQTIQKKIEVNYRPLQTSGGIEVVGSVPDVQVYQADKAEYTPDYTLTPLTLFPRCNATDPDAVVKVGAVNASLTNMKWYERLNGVRTLITSANKQVKRSVRILLFQHPQRIDGITPPAQTVLYI